MVALQADSAHNRQRRLERILAILEMDAPKET